MGEIETLLITTATDKNPLSRNISLQSRTNEQFVSIICKGDVDIRQMAALTGLQVRKALTSTY